MSNAHTHYFDEAPGISTKELAGENWPNQWYIQALMSSQDEHIPFMSQLMEPPDSDSDYDGGNHQYEEDAGRNISPQPTSDAGRLSTIPEAHESEESALTLHTFHSEPTMTVNADASEIPEGPSEADIDQLIKELEAESHTWPVTETPCHLGYQACDPSARDSGNDVPESWHFLAQDANPEGLYQQAETDAEGNTYVELLCPGDVAKLIADSPAPPGTHYRLRVYTSSIKRAVVERDIDILSPSDYKQHAQAVQTATKEELDTWIKHKCFERKPRRGARNVLDVRWVGKWKKVPCKSDPSKNSRVIRMRLTLRGFKDMDALDLETYAGTSTRTSQRIVTSEAACRGWDLTAIDVKKAFLKGISYEELSQLSGAPRREVNFDLPPEAVTILRRCKGFEDFDPRTEVLSMTKPGTGCKDAPKCFALKLAQATNKNFGARPSVVDDQLIMRHTPAGLELLGSKHVDDIKVGSGPATTARFITSLESVFGKGELDVTPRNFTNCGIRHTRTQTGYEVDQTEYLRSLKPIVSSELTGRPGESNAPEAVAKMFLSLLMALAYTLQTRVDLCVYVNALQRHAQTPTCLHVRRLNAIVRWAQRHPLTLRYSNMRLSNRLIIHSDAGFRKEEKDGHDTGRAVRGANYIRTGTSADGRPVAHLLHWECGTIKTVTRSTFTSELQAAISAADNGLLLALQLHEVSQGAVTAAEGLRLREQGGMSIKTVLGIDAMSIWTALAAERTKAPAEKSMLLHLLWLRELLERGILDSLQWLDTRVMSADGHTKGSILRDTLRQLAGGSLPKAEADMVRELRLHRGSSSATLSQEKPRSSTVDAAFVCSVLTHPVGDGESNESACHDRDGESYLPISLITDYQVDGIGLDRTRRDVGPGRPGTPGYKPGPRSRATDISLKRNIP